MEGINAFSSFIVVAEEYVLCSGFTITFKHNHNNKKTIKYVLQK